MAFYGTGIEIHGTGLRSSNILVDGVNQWIDDDSTVRVGDLAWGFHTLQLDFRADNRTQVEYFVFTRAMETNA